MHANQRNYTQLTNVVVSFCGSTAVTSAASKMRYIYKSIVDKSREKGRAEIHTDLVSNFTQILLLVRAEGELPNQCLKFDRWADQATWTENFQSIKIWNRERKGCRGMRGVFHFSNIMRYGCLYLRPIVERINSFGTTCDRNRKKKKDYTEIAVCSIRGIQWEQFSTQLS